MSLIYSKEFDVSVTPRDDIITFNCNPNEEADLHNEEGKCCCYCTEHTYYIAKKLDVNTIVKEIECFLLSGPREYDEYHTIKFYIQQNGEWIHIDNIDVHTQNLTKYNILLDKEITGFKFTGMFMDKSYGKISYKDVTMGSYTGKTTCEQEGGYWYGNICHLTEPQLYELTTQEDCEAHGYYWANNACHKMPTVCEDWLTEQDCVDAGCDWWSEENKCYRKNVKVVEYELPNPKNGTIRVPIGSDWYNKVIDLWYEIDIQYESCTEPSAGSVFLYVKVGGSNSSMDKIYWRCNQSRMNTYEHDWRYKTGATFKGPYVDFKLPDSFKINHFKCKMHVKELDDYYDE